MNPVKIKDRTVDVSGVLPLKIRDWKALEKQGVTLTMLTAASINVDIFSKFLFYIINKADPTITQDDVDDLSMNDSGVGEILKSLEGEQVNRPT